MSKFEILKSGKVSLYKIGLINKLIYALVVMIFPFLGFSWALIDRLNISDDFFITLIALWLIIFIGLIIYSRSINMKLEKLGELDVTLNGIKKTISGFETFFDYGRIREVKVRDHIKSIFFPANKDRAKAYLVTIITDDLTSERFVVSSQSSSSPEVNFLDSLKFIEKYKKMKLRIKR